MNFLWKRSQILSSGADYGREINVALLLGQQFLKKIQKMADEDSHSTDLAWVSWGRSFTQQFYWLITFFLFKLLLRTKLFSHKMLRNLTFVVQFPYFNISPKRFLFFEQLFEKLREIFWKVSSNLWKAPKREQESIPQRWVLPLSVCHYRSIATYVATTQSLKFECVLNPNHYSQSLTLLSVLNSNR